ncbi:MAG: IclR family transcriptional regulator [Rhizobiaceae bacterium]|nr:IclR family transcriptional regulator [Rhizobiaceae bacterium]
MLTTNKGSVRVLHIFSLFAQKPSWGVTEVSREMGCGKNSAFQALDTLLKEGYLVRDASGQRYQLSHRALDFVSDGEVLDVRLLCREYIERLHALTGQAVFLSIIVGRYNVCIDSVQPPGVSVGYSPLSQPIPLHAGTGSRLLLAFLSDEEIQRYIDTFSPLQAVTPATIVEPDQLWEEVRLVRSRGYARGYQDYSTGANYLSFPVFSTMRRPLAAMTIGGPVASFTTQVADAAIPKIQAVMAELNRHSMVFPAVPLVSF